MSRLFYISLVVIVACSAVVHGVHDDAETEYEDDADYENDYYSEESPEDSNIEDNIETSDESTDLSQAGKSNIDRSILIKLLLAFPLNPHNFGDEQKECDSSPVIVIDQSEPLPMSCGINEQIECVSGCPPPRSCKNSNVTIACPAVALPCQNTCVCKPGYYSNYLGECITKAQCDQCPKPNEFYSCGSACDNECKNIKTQSRTNCPIKNIVCVKKCYCEDGYARDAKGNCIPVDQCNKSKCGKNEVIKCVKKCPFERTCNRPVINYMCINDPTPCQNKCVCADGYLRNSIGECILEKECQKCTKPHEFYSCGSICDNECKSFPFQSRTNCPARSLKCVKRCYCDDGYARDDKGNCIPVDQCNKLKCNGPYEIERCVSCPPERTCKTRDTVFNCTGEEKPCINKCVCQPGYFRNDKNVCVPEGQCETTPKPLNCGFREIEACVSRCPPERTCRNRFLMYKCARDSKPCERKCVCEPGYFRNSIGQCITGQQCAQCKKKNEFFSCGSACDNECKNIQYQNRTNCPIINKKCNEKCYCNDGYARDDKGNCIPVNECKPACSDPNEEYVLGRSCPPDVCRSIVAKYKCDSNEVEQYRCRCKSGFYRLTAGTPCIPVCQCPQMANSPNCHKKS